MIAIDCAIGRPSSVISTGTCRDGFSAWNAAACCSPPSLTRFTTRRSNGMPL